MARSLRRAKKSRPVARVGVHKKKKSKAPIPITLPGKDTETQWIQEETPLANYRLLNLARDPNKKFGREKHLTGGKDPVDEIAFEELSDDDFVPDDVVSRDELAAACSKMRSTGKAPPKKLTSKQIGIVEKLIARHGDDTAAMARDRKLNAMQHTSATLAAMVESLRAYPELAKGGWRGFHAPKKRL